MGFLNELEGLEHEDVIKELCKETLPLVMWGAGSSAPEVAFYLRKHGILISDVFVDDEYYAESLMFQGKKVLSFSALKEKYHQVNVILGNSHYEKKEQLEQNGCIANVYGLFSISYNLFEKTPLSEIEQHVSEHEWTYRLLEDELSRQNLLAFLKVRVSGNNKYITEVFEHESNFFCNGIFQIGQDETYLDVGAYDGDTIRLFLKENKGRYGHIYAMEPDCENYRRFENYVVKNHLKNIEIKELGAWNHEQALPFSPLQRQVSGIIYESSALDLTEASHITAMPLDQAFHYKRKVTLLKINYLEGVKEAIEGAERILKMHKPKLAIAVGFDCRNIRCIPGLIKRINPEYKLYLRFNRAMVSGLTLYGIV